METDVLNRCTDDVVKLTSWSLNILMGPFSTGVHLLSKLWALYQKKVI